jgi:hypothetical protein
MVSGSDKKNQRSAQYFLWAIPHRSVYVSTGEGILAMEYNRREIAHRAWSYCSLVVGMEKSRGLKSCPLLTTMIDSLKRHSGRSKGLVIWWEDDQDAQLEEPSREGDE